MITVGRSVKLSADGRPDYKQAGITVDWALVAAAGAPVVLEDGVQVATGEKYLRYGQALALVTASKKYGPYDPAQTDGRQTITKGAFFLLDQTVKENDPHSDHPAVIYGGLVFRDRLIATAGAASLAAGPTYANLEAALPRLQYVLESPN